MKKYYYLIFACLFFVANNSYATHYRAGEIIYRLVAPLTYEADVITYTKTTGTSGGADRDTVQIFWGDGTFDMIVRVNGPDLNGNGIPDGQFVFDDIKKNVYRGSHQYAGIRPFYLISMEDANRINDIININGGGSVNTPFYVEDTIKFYDIASLGYNNSPTLLNPPIDFANVNDTFYHNPNAYDSDGDSLNFELVVPKQSLFGNVPGYQYPNEIIPGANNKFTINSQTGEIIWATPQRTGIYNIAILIREYRNQVLLSTLIRDMQIIVNDYPNDPPVIVDVRDTCIIAGTPLRVRVDASDINIPQQVSLTASGAPFLVSTSPARFDSAYGNPVSSTFEWNTQCEHIRSQFYSVVFRAADNFRIGTGSGSTRVPLVDLETWLIRVIAPPPLNLVANPFNNGINLTWDSPYTCASIPTFRGFSIWRRIGSNNFTPDSCETGLAGRGYTKIADNVLGYNYRDIDVVHGQKYCYRILAHFSQLSPNGLVEYDVCESIPSNEDCAELKRDVPVLIHVDVTNTDISNGSIFVDWVNPTIPALDTILYPGPYKYELYRNEGLPGTSSSSLIQSFNSTSFTGLLLDTFFTDNLLNTKEKQYSYKVNFKYNNDSIVGPTSGASSIYLKIRPQDKSLRLSWNEKVPWSNNLYFIYKQNKITLLYELKDSTISKNYTDTGLINDTLYCYYIESKGRYTGTGYPEPLLNKSQIACERPNDTIPPCAPNLLITNDCGKIPNNEWNSTHWKNYLSWNIPPDSCGDDIAKYKLYFTPTNGGNLILIDSSFTKTDTTYIHDLSNSTGIAGCYRITAVDFTGNETSNASIICIDNCPLYELPNVFTPNGDGANELFKPFPYRFVSKVDFRVHDRWGNLVYQTQNPDILWDGNDMKTGKPLSEGVYLYSGKYYEETLNGLIEKPLPPNKNGGGFIHLMRSK